MSLVGGVSPGFNFRLTGFDLGAAKARSALSSYWSAELKIVNLLTGMDEAPLPPGVVSILAGRFSIWPGRGLPLVSAPQRAVALL